jgi:hypothetical protein
MSTTSEFLDDNEDPYFHYQVLVTRLTAVTFCPPCGHVDDDITTKANHPCGTCQTICPRRRLLYSVPENRLLSMILDCYKRKDSRSLCVLLFCALAEQHIHYLAQRRCEHLRLPYFVTVLLLERHEQFDSRLKLVGRLCGEPIETIGDSYFLEIVTTYRSLRSKRNQLAHKGRAAPYSINEGDIRAAVDQASTSFAVFAALHHRYCSVDSSTVANLESTEP